MTAGQGVRRAIVHKVSGTPEGRGDICCRPQETCAQAIAGSRRRSRVSCDIRYACKKLMSGNSIFEGPWKKIISSTEEIAKSHTLLASRIDKDVEQPLRNFATTNREMSGMTTIQGNLASMAKDLDDAEERSEKLNKKGGKASAQKVESATLRLQTARSLWDSQSPFVFENLQALDERRLNQLRDVLTQYQTHEMDQFERNKNSVEETLNFLLEVETAEEIRNWSQAAAAGRPAVERRTTRQSSVAGSTGGAGQNNNNALPPPPQTPASTHTDNQSEHSGMQDASRKLGILTQPV